MTLVKCALTLPRCVALFPRRCFSMRNLTPLTSFLHNQSFQLSQQNSWYSDRIRIWNSGDSQPKALTETIIGVADYGNNPNNHPVVLKLETATENDIFVGFNRVSGINAKAKDHIDRVTIVEQGGDGKGYSTSVMIQSLGAGQSHTIANWQKSGKNMVITVKSIATGNPWSAVVEFNFNNAVAPTPLPTPKPTPKPTPLPTPKPSAKPTAKPVS